MTQDRVKDILDGQTCLCCMCRCGDHKCLQQTALKLPPSMQSHLDLENRNRPRKADNKEECQLEKADLYRKTIYKQDFCEQPDIIDQFPLHQPRLSDNVKCNSTFGYPAQESTYMDDFIPWSLADQNLCRARLQKPDDGLSRNAKGESGDARKHLERVLDDCSKYYCPTHCNGTERSPVKENCLLGHEKHFNLGPSAPRVTSTPEKSPHPFAKYSNYMLDYKGCKIPPKRRHVPKFVDKSHYPMSSDTSYRDAYTCLPEIPRTKPPREDGDARSTLKTGDGPMVRQSTIMSDYKGHDVEVHKPVRLAKEEYHAPACSMETTTTTGSTYRKWENIPRQVISKRQKELGFSQTNGEGAYQQHETDFRRLISTYQEDFDGINSALCPCRVVEKHGTSVLKPRYCFTRSDRPHDVFCCNRRDVGLRRSHCPHC